MKKGPVFLTDSVKVYNGLQYNTIQYKNL